MSQEPRNLSAAERQARGSRAAEFLESPLWKQDLGPWLEGEEAVVVANLRDNFAVLSPDEMRGNCAWWKSISNLKAQLQAWVTDGNLAMDEMKEDAEQ